MTLLRFIPVILVVLVIIIWEGCIISVYNPDGADIRGISILNVKTQYSNIFNVLKTHVVIWKHEKNRKIPTTLLNNGVFSIGARPVSGDHIHMAISFWVGNSARPAEHDRPYENDVPYEQKEDICLVPGNVAYTKLWPHIGVHTHCDGLIHVHPWSAPVALRREGVLVTLGMWFDQVGIEYRQTGLQFRDGSRYDNNATHKWRIAEYPCFHESKYVVYTMDLDRIWLGHAYGSYVVWFGTSELPPLSIPEHITNLKKVTALGFDGNPYPQSCFKKTL